MTLAPLGGGDSDRRHTRRMYGKVPSIIKNAISAGTAIRIMTLTVRRSLVQLSGSSAWVNSKRVFPIGFKTGKKQ